jgi:hypothetical protein
MMGKHDAQFHNAMVHPFFHLTDFVFWLGGMSEARLALSTTQ